MYRYQNIDRTNNRQIMSTRLSKRIFYWTSVICMCTWTYIMWQVFFPSNEGRVNPKLSVSSKNQFVNKHTDEVTAKLEHGINADVKENDEEYRMEMEYDDGYMINAADKYKDKVKSKETKPGIQDDGEEEQEDEEENVGNDSDDNEEVDENNVFKDDGVREDRDDDDDNNEDDKNETDSIKSNIGDRNKVDNIDLKGENDDSFKVTRKHSVKNIPHYNQQNDNKDTAVNRKETLNAESDNNGTGVNGIINDQVKRIVNVNIPLGPGEMGEGSEISSEHLSADKKLKYEQLYKQHDFNAYASELIAVNRTLPDIRNEGCKRIKYDVAPETSLLPRTSVIICFHNEALSVLLRTIHSILNRSPPYLLKEVILVDDHSTLDDLQEPLDVAISNMLEVRIIRTEKHEGLVRARLIGVANSTAEVLTFLDSHVECFEGWLEPLLDRLSEKEDAVVCPQIQSISAKTFKINIHDQLYVGNFKLSDLSFDWLPIQDMDKYKLASEIDVVRSPIFAGGLFSILKSYFNRIGTYDEQMELWGGETLEMSLRVWMCGGSVEIHPCSHVAHIFRTANPLEKEMDRQLTAATFRNNLRTAEVWMDEYKMYYTNKGNDKVHVGDVSDRKKLRRDLQCESFQWYINNVYPGLYIPGQGVNIGEIRNPSSGLCIDSMADGVGLHVGVAACNGNVHQYWHLSSLNALQRETGCVSYSGDVSEDGQRLILQRCTGGGPTQFWVYTDNKWLYNPDSGRCLAIRESKKELCMQKCQDNERFYWSWTDTGLEQKLVSS